MAAAPGAAPASEFASGLVDAAKTAVSGGAVVQGVGQMQKCRVPFRQTIVTQFGVDAVIAVAVDEALAQVSRLGVGVDVTQCIQRTAVIVGWKTGAEIALLPEMAGAFEHAIERHSRVPVEPVHDLGQVLGVGRL